MILLFFNILTSIAQALENSEELIKQKESFDAKAAASAIHEEYFQCYALNPEEKLQCSKKNLKNHKLMLYEKLKSNPLYTTAFIHEAERLGFVWFLNTRKLSCDRIDEGPVFNETLKAYNVFCKNGNTYHLEFDSLN